MAQKYDMLYYNYSFVHWLVGEGLESGETSEWRENLEALIKDYAEVVMEHTETGVEEDYDIDSVES